MQILSLFFARGHNCTVCIVWFATTTAWFGLTAPLFTLDQCVHLTAPQVQGEGGEWPRAVLFSLTAKVYCSWQGLIFSSLFYFILLFILIFIFIFSFHFLTSGGILMVHSQKNTVLLIGFTSS